MAKLKEHSMKEQELVKAIKQIDNQIIIVKKQPQEEITPKKEE